MAQAQQDITKKRLTALRATMKKQALDAYLIPRQDEYQGEYVGAYAERLRWLTGFAGSWGVAIVTQKKALIFVDGRYTLQVREQIDTKLIEPRHLMDEPPARWLQENFGKGARIGFDPRVTSIAEARRLQDAVAKNGARLVPVARNLVDVIWNDQPPRPSNPAFVHPETFAGRSVAQKLDDIAKVLKSQNASAAVLGDPASVCWLLNLRGSDTPCTPFLLAYAIVTAKARATLYVAPSRIPAELRKALAPRVKIARPEQFEADLRAMGKAKQRVSLDGNLVSEQARLLLSKAGASILEAQDPCVLPKARKNEVEQQGARDAQLRDGAALSSFLCWVDENATLGGVTELTAAERLRAFRETTGKLRDLSFESISASGPNAAIPHYHLKPGTERPLRAGEIYLIDSGGQYQDGTTDVTRTMMIGPSTDEIRDRFTRVLKGMIGVSLLRFPQGTTGAHIDAIARAALWKAGLDFDHGTGHGVGSYLSVHEGPARISKTGHVALEPGMLLSNEPGYYKNGHFGIRTENLLIVTPPAKLESGDREMLGFETITLAPIDRKLIVVPLLTREELDWLNAYHARVLNEISPLVSEATKRWLETACAPLSPRDGEAERRWPYL